MTINLVNEAHLNYSFFSSLDGIRFRRSRNLITDSHQIASQAHLRLIASINDNENQRVETKYLSMSDHEETLSLNDSGVALGELLGISANEPMRKVMSTL